MTIPCTRRRQGRARRSARSTSAARSSRSSAGKMLFAIDQQQYLQGYLPVVFAMLYVTNLNTVGNGAARADRAGDHQQGERGPGRRAGRARARAERRSEGRRRPPATAGRPSEPTAAARRRASRPRRPARAAPHPPGHRARSSARSRSSSRSRTSRAPSTGSATPASRPAGPTRRRNSGSSPCRSRC